MVNDQKPRFSFCIVTEPHNFKTLSFLQHGYHTPQHKNIAGLGMTPAKVKKKEVQAGNEKSTLR